MTQMRTPKSLQGAGCRHVKMGQSKVDTWVKTASALTAL